MSVLHEPSIAEQRQFWDWHWRHWKERKTVNEWKDKRHETILSFLRSLSLDKPTILDLGCGPGWYTEKLAQFGSTTGIDLSEEAIQMAQSRFPHVKFISGNLYDLPLPAGHFDVVVSQEVFDHVEDQVGFVKRAAYTLKPGGYLIMSCANKFVMDRVGRETFPKQPSEHITHYLNRRSVTHLLQSQFNIIRVRSIIPIGNRGVLRLVNSHKLNTALGVFIPLRYLEAVKERVWLGWQFIILARKRF